MRLFPRATTRSLWRLVRSRGVFGRKRGRGGERWRDRLLAEESESLLMQVVELGVVGPDEKIEAACLLEELALGLAEDEEQQSGEDRLEHAFEHGRTPPLTVRSTAGLKRKGDVFKGGARVRTTSDVGQSSI
jgi:hypothetical protein